jgi:hypothetical protein
MDKGKIIDLDKEFADLFRHEQLLGYFDFKCVPPGRPPLPGICKMSRLREEEAESRYFSLLFILDTPEEGDWKAADEWISAIEWEKFQGSLTGSTKVVSIPYTSFSRNYYLKEIYIYVSPNADYQRPYATRVLFPALKSLTGFELSPPVFMEDVPPKAVAAPAPPADVPAPMLDRIKRLFSS